MTIECQKHNDNKTFLVTSESKSTNMHHLQIPSTCYINPQPIDIIESFLFSKPSALDGLKQKITQHDDPIAHPEERVTTQVQQNYIHKPH